MPGYPYYKLAKWDARALTFRDGKQAFATEAVARGAAKAAGEYRISTVTFAGRTDGEPFTVVGMAAAEAKPKFTKGGLRKRPGPWNTYGGAK